MAKDKSSVLNEVLVSLATEAAQDVEGVHLLNSKRNCGAVSVYVLPNEKVGQTPEQGKTVEEKDCEKRG